MVEMKRKKLKLVMLLTVCLMIGVMLLTIKPVSAASDLANAPSDWAFEASSVELNDAIVQQYPVLDNGDGFVTILSANSFTGSIYIVNDNITGTINGIEHFTSISHLNLSLNQLSGEIPADIGKLSNLQRLSLYNNQLSGEIPDGIGNLSNLELLDLSHNQLSGEIPETIGDLSNIEELLNLSDNQLSGMIPNSIGNLNKLQALSIYDNQISGEIPETIGNLNNLTYIGLRSNQISGEIPESIGNLSELSYLDLGDNQLNGEIPSSFGNLTKLFRLLLFKNELSGKIPDSFYELTNLYWVSLDNNNLTGEISEKISNLTNLELLNLAYNQLSGEVPKTIADMPDFGSMYLQHNHLTSIPLKATNKFVDMMNNGTTGVVYSVANQNYTEQVNETGIANNIFAFDTQISLYEQNIVNDYGLPFKYELINPDGVKKEIVPSFSNGQIIINAQDLTQVGEYRLIGTMGYIDGSIFNNEYEGNGVRELEYTSIFKVKESKIPTNPDPEKSGGGVDTNNVTKSSTSPQTGDNNTPSAILFLIVGFLASVGYLIARRSCVHFVRK